MKRIYASLLMGCLMVGGQGSYAEELPSATCMVNKTAEAIGACLDKRHQEWDDQLNSTYKALMAQLPPEEKMALRNIQRAWLKTRSQQCDGLAENDKKACYLDETKKKEKQLEIHYLAQITGGHFEGDWRIHLELYDAYHNIILIQKDKRVCGIWQDIPSGTGQLVGDVIKDNFVKISKKCGVGYGACAHKSNDNIPINQWENNESIGLKVCKGKLYYAEETENCADLIEDHNEEVKEAKELGRWIDFTQEYSRYPLLKRDKKSILYREKWILDCLNPS